MNIANLYRKLKQILEDSNTALVNRNLNEVNSLSEIPAEINKLGSINRLPYFLNQEIVEIIEDDLNGVTNIVSAQFENFNNLTSITIPDGVTSIGDNAFYGCESLTSIIIPASVTSIGDWVFSNCSKLTDITIKNGITTIGINMFYGCTNLTNVTIPDSVTSIGIGAFDGCYRLTDIYLKPTTPPTLGDTYAIPSTTTIHVPVGSGDAYKSATNWSYHSDRIVEDIEIK